MASETNWAELFGYCDSGTCVSSTLFGDPLLVGILVIVFFVTILVYLRFGKWGFGIMAVVLYLLRSAPGAHGIFDLALVLIIVLFGAYLAYGLFGFGKGR